MSRVYFDTETTGLPSHRLALDHPDQPKICSFAWKWIRDAGDSEEKHFYIKPQGWIIPPELTAIHGITTEQCIEEGVLLCEVLDEFQEICNLSEEVIGYNIGFDMKMCDISARFINRQYLQVRRTIDVMVYATDFCQMPPTSRMQAVGIHRFKNPKLSEALSILCGKEFPGAHNALNDVLATEEVYERILLLQHGEGPEAERAREDLNLYYLSR